MPLVYYLGAFCSFFINILFFSNKKKRTRKKHEIQNKYYGEELKKKRSYWVQHLHFLFLFLFLVPILNLIFELINGLVFVLSLNLFSIVQIQWS